MAAATQLWKGVDIARIGRCAQNKFEAMQVDKRTLHGR
jgi:hypothetical protein